MTKHAVCYADELHPGQRRIIEVSGRSIGVFNVDDQFYAVRNRCPHKGAPLCRGMIKGLVVGDKPYEYEITRDGEILKCPWHGWEFDLTNGRSVFNPHKLRVKSYDVSVEPEALAACAEMSADDEDPSIETFPVSIEEEPEGRRLVFVHIT